MADPLLPPPINGSERRLDLILAELKALREVVAELRPPLPPALYPLISTKPAEPSSTRARSKP
jgi:hypothetical protein